MYDSWLTGTPWRHFMKFISPSADRFTMLIKLFEEAALDYKVLNIAGNRHLIAAPPLPEEKFLRRPPTILVAHYDRANDSPGANDNSAGVFLLFETAMKLKKDGVNNWIIIFTDKEELKSGESIQAQGAYTLAAKFKDLKIENAKIFNFDTCGTGDTLIISTTLEYLLKKEGSWEKLREPIMELRNIALDAARNLGMKKVLLTPVPFSDDAGFLRAGLIAQTITVLPSAECIQLVYELRKNHEFTDVLIKAELRQANPGKFIPETWRCLNSSRDSYIRLTPKHYKNIVRFAEALCRG